MKVPVHFPLYKNALRPAGSCVDSSGNIPATPRAFASNDDALRTRAGASFFGGGA